MLIRNLVRFAMMRFFLVLVCACAYIRFPPRFAIRSMSCFNLSASVGSFHYRSRFDTTFFRSITIFIPEKGEKSILHEHFFVDKFLVATFLNLSKSTKVSKSYLKQIEKEEKTENGEKKKESHARFIKCKKERRKGSPRVPSLPLKNHRCSRLRRSTSDFRVMYQTAYKREREREGERRGRRIFIKFFKRWIDFIRSYVVQITLRYAGAR